MKKLIFLSALLILFTTANAQLIRGYGLKLGTTIANQEWDYSANAGLSSLSFDSDKRMGFNAGIFAEFFNIPLFSIVGELNYIQKGMKEDIPVTTIEEPDGTDEFVTWENRIDYINLAAFAKLRLDAGLFSPYVIAGPKIDFQINKSNSFGTSAVVGDFKKNKFGFKVGVGTEINLVAVRLLAEFLYDADFNELYENNNLKVNSNSFDLRVGIML